MVSFEDFFSSLFLFNFREMLPLHPFITPIFLHHGVTMTWRHVKEKRKEKLVTKLAFFFFALRNVSFLS
jgi:hypothetical protein